MEEESNKCTEGLVIQEHSDDAEDFVKPENITETRDSIFSDTDPPFPWKNLLMIGILLTVGNMATDIFTSGLEPLLVNAGAHYKDAAILSFVAYPRILSCLISPIIDSLYSDRFGKRKSYIIPSFIVMSIVLITESFFIESHITDLAINNVVIAGCITTGAYIVMNVAISGWRLTLLPSRYYSYGVAVSLFGNSLGMVIVDNVFVALSNKTIGDIRVFRPQIFLAAVGILALIIVICLWLFYSEVSVCRSSNIMNSPQNVLKALWAFATNRYVLALALFVFFNKFALLSILHGTPVILQTPVSYTHLTLPTIYSV
eukprot:TRINITY_DN8508_c0_g1_i2.p1 TRINITY_DN8508_c0_g1~~TRINITY_DN8508_c0_g1_i2.p1  ORF type:complete len:315 (-),score=41.09 TRINITY_DN8508_c0_g1_i2:36-980(-)